ncbi:MAG TPA: DUF4911 domain-containing protein [Thermodesulfobacteriota bacterium]|nr:DUF4911 domain-containing protein [Thermodesulfobacteriota bacterium]
MAIIHIRLKNPSETVLFQAILGSYSHLGWVRTEQPEEGIMMIFTTDDLVDEVRKVLQNLKSEMGLEEL